MNITNSIYYTPYTKLLKNNISFCEHAKGRNYYTQLAPIFDAISSRESFTKEEVDLLFKTAHQYMGYQPRIFLDIACGAGRHMHEIANRGCEAYGLDTSSRLLQIAKKKIPSAHFYKADMRSFEINQQFDCAYTLWDSYVYLSRLSDMKAFAKRCSAQIKRGGILVLDSKNYQKQLTDGISQHTYKTHELQIDTFIRRKAYRRDKVFESIFTNIIQGVNTNEACIVVDQTLVRTYDLEEVVKIFEPYGFKFMQCYGSFRQSKYNKKYSDRMIAVLKRF